LPDFGLSQLFAGVPDFVFAATMAAAGLHGSAISEIAADGLVQPRDGAAFERVFLSADMPFEKRGTRLSQRVEAKEGPQSDDANVAGKTVWYAFSVYVDPITGLPRPAAEEDSAKLSLAQFHQRDQNDLSTRPALMFYMLGDGSIYAQFEEAVGKRSYKLVSGGRTGRDATGTWIDILVGARWDTKPGGWTEFWVRQGDDKRYERVARDEGPNTSTGRLYFKYGLYRSFLERDPWLAKDDGLAYYDAVRRGSRMRDVRLPAKGKRSYEVAAASER
jgi:hypothetical protein